MAKVETKPTVHKIEDTLPTAAEVKSNVVSLEMTEEQKAEVVKFLAEKADKEEMKEALAEVVLRYEHQRNGVKYGPGKVVCNRGLASEMFAQDQLAFQEMLSAKEGGEKLIQMFDRGMYRIRQVKNASNLESSIK